MTISVPPVTVSHHDHAAAAAYLMTHADLTVLAVLDGQWPGRVIGIITQDDISQAMSAGLDLDQVRVRDLITELEG